MTTEQLRKLIKTTPFEPFTIHMADGKEVLVRHPEFILLPPQSRTFVVWEDDAKAFGIIDLLLVTQLTVKPNGKPKNTNGGKKRKNGKRKKS